MPLATIDPFYEFPVDVKSKRELLFNPCDHLELSKEEFELYWPYIDNAWSRSAAETNSKGHRVEYFRCRQWRKQTQTPAEDDTRLRKRQKRARAAIGCEMKILATHTRDGVIISRGKHCPDGHIDTLADADEAKLPSFFVKVAAAGVNKGQAVTNVACLSGADNSEKQVVVADAGGRWPSRQGFHNAVTKLKKTNPRIRQRRKREDSEIQLLQTPMSPSTNTCVGFATPPSMATTRVSLPLLAKMIDLSLLDPTTTDAEISTGLALCKRYNVAAACIKPSAISQARQALEDSSVKICPVIGFPHGNSTIDTKVFEATQALREGAQEIDMVVNIGKVRSEDWTYVEDEIRRLNGAVFSFDAVLKVTFENDLLNQGQIIKLCEICTSAGVAYAKTSTGFGFVKRVNGMFSYDGATREHLQLMRRHCGDKVQIKAAGNVNSLDDLIRARALGCTRVGAEAAADMLEEARNRGIGEEEVLVQVYPTITWRFHRTDSGWLKEKEKYSNS